MMKTNNSPSISDLLLATLASGRSVRRFRAILRDCELERYKEESVQVTLSRLHKKGYLHNSTAGWSITKKGTTHFKNARLLDYIQSPFEKNAANHTVISFDIPEPRKTMRNWLRNQIKIFGYTMLQQSLWVGPGPLPSSFLKRLDDLGIRKNIKTFRIAKKARKSS